MADELDAFLAATEPQTEAPSEAKPTDDLDSFLASTEPTPQKPTPPETDDIDSFLAATEPQEVATPEYDKLQTSMGLSKEDPKKLSPLVSSAPAEPTMKKPEVAAPIVAQPTQAVISADPRKEAMARWQAAPEGSPEKARWAGVLEKFRNISTQGTDLAAESAEALEQAGTTAYVGYRGALSGLTMGLSDIAVRNIEQKYFGGKINAETGAAMLNEGIGKLAGGYLTGSALVKGLAGKLGAEGLKGMLALRFGAGSIQAGTNAISSVLAGDRTAREAAGDFGQNLGSMAVNAVTGNALPRGVANFITQVGGDFAYDFLTDKYIRGRLTDENFKEWLLQVELPQLVGSLVFAGRDATNKNFNMERTKVLAELKSKLFKDVRTMEAGTKEMAVVPPPTPQEKVFLRTGTEAPIPETAKTPTTKRPREILEEASEKMTREGVIRRAGEIGAEQAGVVPSEAKPTTEPAMETSPVKTIPEPTFGTEKEKKFLGRVKGAEDTPSQVLDRLTDVPAGYEQQKTGEMVENVKAWLPKDKGNVAEAEWRIDSKDVPIDTKGAIGVALMEHYRKTGNANAEATLVKKLDEAFRSGGRLVQAASFYNKLSGKGWDTLVNRYLRERGISVPQKDLADIRKMFSDASKLPEGTTRDQATLDAIMKLNSHVPMRMSDWVDAYRYSNMLSNPQSHERNIVGNLVNTVLVKPLVSVMHGDIKQAGQYIGSALGRVFDRSSWSEAAKAMRGSDLGKWSEQFGNPKMSVFDAIRFQHGPQSPFGSKAWNTVTFIPKLMNATDVWFRNVIETGETTRLVKSGVAPEAAQARAKETANQLLYRNPLSAKEDMSLNAASRKLEVFGAWLDKGRNKGFGLKWFISFIKTPFRVAQLAVDTSPLGYATRGMNTEAIAKSKYGKSFAKLDDVQKTDVSQELYQRQGLARLGTAVTAIGAMMAAAGRTTWAAPKDEKARKEFYASGRRPYSVLIGDRWVPLSYTGPLMLALGFPAAVRDAFYDNPKAATEEWYQHIGRSAAAMPQMILQMTPVSGLSGLLDALSGDYDKTISGQLGAIATQMIPASGLLRWMNKMVDPTFRHAKGAWQGMATGLPWFSQGVAPITTPTGEPAQRNMSDIWLPYTVERKNAESEKRYQALQEQARQRAKLNQLNVQRP